MPISPAEQAILDRLRAGIAAAAARIRDLIDNPPDDAAFDTQLDDIATGLEALSPPVTPPTP